MCHKQNAFFSMREQYELIDGDSVNFQNLNMEELSGNDSVALQTPNNFTVICDNNVCNLCQRNLGITLTSRLNKVN